MTRHVHQFFLILYVMNLSEVKLNTKCVIQSVNIKNEKIKLRLMELGLNVGVKVIVKSKSLMKKTLLIVFNNSCFTIGIESAKNIVVAYA